MLNPRFVERGSFTIVGVTVTGHAEEIDYAGHWQNRYGPLDAVLRPLSLDGGSYGVSFNEGHDSVYMAGVAAADQAALPAGTEKRVIPAARYAVFDCEMSTMADTMMEIQGQWFHASGMVPDNSAVGFEHYLPGSRAGETRVELYIPIKPGDTAPLKRVDDEMTVFEAISTRRSIRRFKSDPVPEDTLRRILQAGLLAPSGNNRQPWKFYAVRGNKRGEMAARLREGLANREKEGQNTAGARHSFEIMEQAPVSVFIFRSNREAPWLASSWAQHFSDVVDVQSVGAAIENMLLEAQSLGIGSLWVCDVFSACDELSGWLGERTEMIAAVCLGYADEHPVARKRMEFDAAVEWV